MTDLLTAPGPRPALRRWSTFAAAVAGLGLLATAVPAQAATPAPPPRKIVTGWMPYWSTAASTAAVVANQDLFSEASPFWYSATWTGSTSAVTQQVSNSGKSSTLAALRAAGVPVVPSFTDGMPAGRMAKVMKGSASRATFINRLVALAVDNGYAGIDLDFEKFAFSDGRASWPSTRPVWVTFVAQLASALHQRGKILSVTTPPLYDAGRTSSSGYWVYDWAGIAPHVDRLRIMTYDYSVSGYPIAPFYWVESVIKFAVTQVPSGKVQVGVASYGRSRVLSWKPTPTAASQPKIIGTCPTNRPSNYKSVQTFDASSIDSVAPTVATKGANWTKTAAVRTWNASYSGRSGTYETKVTYSTTFTGVTSGGKATSCTVYRTGWYDEAKAAQARAGLVGKYRLAGIAQWTIGGEDKAQWKTLRNVAQSIAPARTAVTVTAPGTAAHSSPITVSVRATANGVAVPNATATLWFKSYGSSTWRSVRTSRTGTNGVVAFATATSARGYYRGTVGGTYDRSPGQGTSGLVSLRSSVSVRAPSTARPGQGVTVSVHVGPGVKGQTVKRQVLRRGSWVTLAKARTSARGNASFSFTAGSKGTATYRAVALKAGHLKRNARSFTVIVG